MQNVYMIVKEHAHLMAKQAVGHQIQWVIHGFKLANFNLS